MSTWHVSLWSTQEAEPRQLGVRSFFVTWYQQHEQVRQALHRPGWIDRSALSVAMVDKEFLVRHANEAIRSGDFKNGLNLLVNLSRIHADRFAGSLSGVAQLLMQRGGTSVVSRVIGARSSRRGLQAEDASLRMLRMLLGHEREDDERFLREAMVSQDEYAAFAAKCLLIDKMLGDGRETAAFDEFKKSWPARCIQPYVELIVAQQADLTHPTRAYRPCCPYLDTLATSGTTSPIEFSEIWNSVPFAHARMDVHRPSIAGGGCRGCFRQGVTAEEIVAISLLDNDDPGPLQRENLAKVRRHFLRGDVVLKSRPVALSLNLGVSCNLRCVMCSARWSKYSKAYDILPEHLPALFPLLPHANYLSLSGGEPLLSPTTRYLADYVIAHPEINDYLIFAIVTNGTLLGRCMEWLTALKRLSIVVSLDGIRDSYRHIRGGSWEQVEASVLQVHEYARSMPGRWRVETANVLMKSSLGSLREFASWHCRHKLRTRFAKVLFFGDDPLIPEEDLLACPGLLRDIPDWREILHESIAMFEEAKDATAVQSLRHYRDELTSRVAAEGLDNTV